MKRKTPGFFNVASKGFYLAVFSGVLTLANAQTAPEFAEIRNVQLSGSGCQEAEVAVSLSPDFKDISLLFDNYMAEIGQGSMNPSRLELTKDCQITLSVNVPQGWQMAFRAVDYRGFVNLSGQGWAFQRFSILQDGAPIVSMREANLKGPMNDDYYVRSEVRPERLTWSPCLGGHTNVRLLSQLGVRLNPRSTDRSLTQITIDSADGSIQQNLAVEWRRCSFRSSTHTGGGTVIGNPRNPRFPEGPRVSERPPVVHRPGRYYGR